MAPSSSAAKEPDKDKEPVKEPATENKTYGSGKTMPVLAADKYAEINLPDLPWWDPMADPSDPMGFHGNPWEPHGDSMEPTP